MSLSHVSVPALSLMVHLLMLLALMAPVHRLEASPVAEAQTQPRLGFYARPNDGRGPLGGNRVFYLVHNDRGVFSEAYGPGGPNGYSIFYGEPANAYGASYGVQYGQAGPVYGDPNGYAYASPLAQDSAGGAYGAYGSTYGNTYGYGDTYGYGQLNEPKP